MSKSRLTRYESKGVTLLGDTSRPGGVTLAFTERTGGTSKGCWSSLNLGSRCGDDPEAVEDNRLLALQALGAEHLHERLLCPKQVHGREICCVSSHTEDALVAAKFELEAGRDAVVCTAKNVPVLLCYADCVPIVLCAPGAFAVVHSGWRGTIARIAEAAVETLCQNAQVVASEVSAYLGPYIAGADYEVDEELLARFVDAFGEEVRVGERGLDLGHAVADTLVCAGLSRENILDPGLSTATNLDRFYSYRAEDGSCGRHGALAVILDEDEKV